MIIHFIDCQFLLKGNAFFLITGTLIGILAATIAMVLVKSAMKSGAKAPCTGTETDLYPLTKKRLKPHFINNILTSIYYLCDSDSGKAQDLTLAFSGYLLGTLDTMNHHKPVQFAAEMDLIKNYMALEKQRFGDKLRVEYDMDVTDFKVPPLSILALVENAVKHGIANKEGGGTLKIATRLLADGSIQIIITDSGVGFDTDAVGKSAAACELDEIRNLLKKEGGGDMTISSKPGEGSTVTVTLHPDN